MFSVPIGATPEVIRKYAPLIRPGSLSTDVTSRKVQAVKAMVESTDKNVK